MQISQLNVNTQHIIMWVLNDLFFRREQTNIVNIKTVWWRTGLEVAEVNKEEIIFYYYASIWGLIKIPFNTYTWEIMAFKYSPRRTLTDCHTYIIYSRTSSRIIIISSSILNVVLQLCHCSWLMDIDRQIARCRQPIYVTTTWNKSTREHMSQ